MMERVFFYLSAVGAIHELPLRGFSWWRFVVSELSNIELRIVAVVQVVA
jgi:hypothetical protein